MIICKILINCDIVEILCEKLCTSNALVISIAINCLKMLMGCQQFFESRRIIFVLDTIVRVIHVSVAIECSDDQIVSDCLKLVSFLLDKTFEHRISSACNIPLVLNNIWKVLKANKGQILNVSNVVLSIMQFKEVEDYFFLITPVLEAILSSLLQDNGDLHKTELIVHLSLLGKHTMNLLMKQNGQIMYSNQNTANIFNTCLMMTEKFLVPFILKTTNSTASDVNITFLVLQVIQSVFLCDNETAKIDFAVYLLQNGFLQTLQNFEYRMNCWPQWDCARSLLTGLLASLCQKELGDENWYGLLADLKLLPPRSSYTNLPLRTGTHLDLFAIIFNYFKCIPDKKYISNTLKCFLSIWVVYYIKKTAIRPSVDENFLSRVCIYISLLKETPSPPIVKAIWFIFAVACRGVKDELNVKSATRQVLEFVNVHGVRKVFTRHSILLSWIFASQVVKSEMKATAVKLWLEGGKTEAINEFKDLKIHKEFIVTILEILATSDETASLVEQFVYAEGNCFAEDAWSLLPKLISSCVPQSKTNNFFNLTTLLRFCTVHKPGFVEQSVILRIACLLPGVIASHYFDSNESTECKFSIGLLFLSIILQEGLRFKDERVFVQLLNHKKFLTFIESSLSSQNNDLLISILNFLYIIIEFQARTNIESSKVIVLFPQNVLRLVSKETDVASLTLKLLATFFTTIAIQANLVLNITPPSATQLRILYIQIHMHCSQSCEEAEPWSWICLHSLLKYSKQLNLHRQLADLEYTNQLLKLCTPSKPSWGHVLQFVSVWITCVPTFSQKALKMTQSQKMIVKIFRLFLQKYTINTEDESLQIFTEALGISSLPNEIETLLRSNLKK
ncbi:uncharacterized protein LOC106672232 isoform X3 [Cimex lectularius]|uniref:Uncharacterized protein n=1 Tax=Cimex lectularius TaxID=79782 RepID=A0A8I6S9B8_CIMLE|nr:uncharacterized protein LOC106672232 isoform X3 [Cimex lectularius]